MQSDARVAYKLPTHYISEQSHQAIRPVMCCYFKKQLLDLDLTGPKYYHKLGIHESSIHTKISAQYLHSYLSYYAHVFFLF